MRKTILVFIDWFDPGYKAGGPIRSVVNFAKQLQHSYNIYVFTSDRDLGAAAAYDGIETNKWTDYAENVQVFYCSPDNLTRATIDGVIKSIDPAVFYLNSMFSKHFTIYPLLAYRQSNWKYKVVLAPRGMLQQSAMRYKALKKKMFLFSFKLFGFHRHITFQATDETECNDIKRYMGGNVQVCQASNFGAEVASYPGSIAKKEGELRIVFISRLHPRKNLDYLLRCLPQVSGQIFLSVVGIEEDKDFVAYCRDIIKSFPVTIKVVFKGPISNNKLPAIIAEHHIFGVPTLGENFGHAIFEALAAGRPALISNCTPWKNLQQHKAGWDLPLEHQAGFVEVLQEVVNFKQEEYDKWSLGAWSYVNEVVNNNELKIIYQKLFN